MFIYSKKTSHANIQIEIERELGSQEAKNLKTVLDNIANGDLPFYGVNEMNLTRSMVNAAIGTNENVNYTNDGIQYSDKSDEEFYLRFTGVDKPLSAMSIIRGQFHLGLIESKSIIDGYGELRTNRKTIEAVYKSLQDNNIGGYRMGPVK